MIEEVNGRISEGANGYRCYHSRCCACSLMVSKRSVATVLAVAILSLYLALSAYFFYRIKATAPEKPRSFPSSISNLALYT